MKGKILEILRKDGDLISGENLCNIIGVSRVAIWKHIRKLQELGYPIESKPKGYQLKEDTDFLFPWEFQDRREKIHYFPEASSTMEIAMDLARKKCPDFTVVIAGTQKKGRGRLKRIWLSEQGGLYFTLILRPKIPPALTPKINFGASLCLAQILREMYGIEAGVKWPNDILVQGKKISGMLSQMDAEVDQVNCLNIGIGLNVNNDPTTEEPNASSLKIILGTQCSRKKILTAFLNSFENWMKNPDLETVIEEWKKYTITINKQVKIITTNSIFEGIAVDVDQNGALLLQLEDETIKTVTFGDCFHQ